MVIFSYQHYNSEWKGQAELDWSDGIFRVVGDEYTHREKP